MTDTYPELPESMFCKCKNGRPCFDTCFEIQKAIADEKQKVLSVLEGWLVGMMYLYEHQGFSGQAVCEVCKEVVNAGSPCTASKYYETWKILAELRAKLVEMKGRL